MHGANLIRALKKNDPGAEFRCFGGDMMKEAGASLFLHYRDMALMGGIEVLRRLPVVIKNRKLCRKDLLLYRSDVLILIDFSGFNLPMARFAAGNGIKVIYYISPKLWAWAKWRVKTVRTAVDKMIVNLPFEKDFYKDHGIDAEYFGNPVLDSITQFEEQYIEDNEFHKKNGLDGRKIIALLAGSRKQEISLLLPEMLSVVPYYKDYQFVIAGAPAISPAFYGKIIHANNVKIVYGKTYELLKHSYAAVVTSGTATLETALLGVPEVVVYKTSALTFFIGNFFVKVKYFSLVNLILNRDTVKELLQKNLATGIRTELERIVFNSDYRSHMLEDFDILRKKLGLPGVAGRVAKRITELVSSFENHTS